MGERGEQAGESAAGMITQWVEFAATGIELLAAVIIVAVILTGTALYVFQILARCESDIRSIEP